MLCASSSCLVLYPPCTVVRSVTFPGKVGNGGRVPAAAVACRINALTLLRGRQRDLHIVTVLLTRTGRCSLDLATVLLSRWSRLHAAQTEQTVDGTALPGRPQSTRRFQSLTRRLPSLRICVRILSYHLELISVWLVALKSQASSLGRVGCVAVAG